MFLHAYTDANPWRAGYYIVETEESYSELYTQGEWDCGRANSTYGEMVAIRLLLESESVRGAEGMAVFSDAEPVIQALEGRIIFRRKKAAGLAHELRRLLAARDLLVYAPRFIWIKHTRNLADKTIRGKTITLDTGTKKAGKTPKKERFNSDGSWKYKSGLGPPVLKPTMPD